MPVFRLLFVAVWVALTSICNPPPAEAQVQCDNPVEVPPPTAPHTRFAVTISRETTFFTEPLTNDGFVDYVAALNGRFGRGVKPEENAAVVLWRITRDGASDDATRDYRQNLLEHWGIEPPTEPVVPVVPLYDPVSKDFSTVDRLYQQEQAASDGPWATEELPAIAAWLEANEQVLQIACEAARRPHYFNPVLSADFVGNDSRGGPATDPVKNARLVSRLLRMRAMLRIHQERYGEAWSDLMVTAQLGRLLAQGATLTEWLVGIGIESSANAGMRAYLQHAPIDTKTVQRCRRDLAELPRRQTAIEVIDVYDRVSLLALAQHVAERTQGFDYFEEMFAMRQAREPVSPVVKAVVYNKLWRPDWDVALRRVNRCYDRFAELLKIKSYSERKRAVEAYCNEVARLPQTLEENLNWLAGICNKQTHGVALGEQHAAILIDVMSMPLAIKDSEDRLKQYAELMDVGFALAAWRADHGDYPDMLEDLVPRYIKQVPGDRFSGGKLIYRRRHGGYVLNSVGSNGQDDSNPDQLNPLSAKDDVTLQIEATAGARIP